MGGYVSASEDKIDPDSLAALKKLLLQFPGGINAIGDLSKRRLALNSITKKITEIEHSDIEVRDFLVPSSNQDRNIALRAYSAKNGRDNELKPCLFYVHGGGMIMGDLETGNLQCLSFASRFNLIVIAIDYRKSPEFPYPAAINDCFDGITWIASNCELFDIDPTNIGIYGSSAGGGLALGTALKIRDAGLAILKYMLPIYPMIDNSNSSASSLEITNLGIWDRDTNLAAWNWYLNGAIADEYAAPARAEDLSKLPPCYSDVGNFDLFRDENSLFFERLAMAGVPTEFKVFPGAFHGSENLAPESALSKEIWENRFRALQRFIEQ